MHHMSIYTVKLVREGSLPYRLPLGEHATGTYVAADLIAQYLRDSDREHFIVLLLNQKNVITGITTVHTGTLTGSLVSPRDVFKPAILGNARSIIIAHNHPSGDPAPSKEDTAITQRLVECGKLLDILVTDHIIVGYTIADGGSYTYYSFAEKDLLGGLLP